ASCAKTGVATIVAAIMPAERIVIFIGCSILFVVIRLTHERQRWLAGDVPKSISTRREDQPQIASRRSSKDFCPSLILARAAARSNHSARSTSGNVCCFTLRGGHSSSNVLLWM